MPRSKRNSQSEPEPAPEFPTDVDFDFTPPQSENQPTTQPQSNIRSFPSPPAVGRFDRLTLPEIEGLVQILHTPDLNFTMPDFVGSMPTDLYRPSTSSIPEINDEEFQREALSAHNKLNAVKLENLSLEIVEEKSKGAITAARIASNVATALVNFRDAQVKYLVGIDAADVAYDIGMKKNAANRDNSEKEVSLIHARGRTIDAKIAGQDLKTRWEEEKNANTQLYVDHEVNKREPIQEKLSKEIEELKNSVSESRQKLTYG